MNALEVGLKTYTHSGTDYIVVELCVDGSPLADFSYDATDLEELMRSEKEDGEFFILTCWCGVPSCTGIERGVTVHHQGNQIHWHVPQPLPQRDFVITRQNLETVLLALTKQIKRFVAERTYSDKRPYEITPMQNEPFFSLG